ncbi:MocR-like pyridoxine biosynthesis transcription factor PdxR [Burkholderia alba]|uniref:MocR-like pyridoxine biosynthesis transcription factor PdxR n=1 Tax=Burkholderia alba TaxID=2683677 RepID=UPI002B051B18|nr:PLP-dependent aminotransferase family protein [Burkholderia alba]
MLRTWKLTLKPARRHNEPVHLQIVQAIVDDIRRGRLPSGTALPGTRVLAADLGVNRKTVVLAYDELTAQGWLETEAKRGSFVSSQLPPLEAEPAGARDQPFPVALPDDGLDLYRSLAGSGTPADRRGRKTGFADGVPDTRLIPFDVLSRAFRHALVTSTRANALGYADPRGAPELREAIAAMLRAERALNVGPDNICIVRGSQMGIFLAARLLTRPGDTVAFEALSYPPARAAFRSCGATLASVDLDPSGLVPESLEALCRRQPVRAVFTTPHHQFPTTVTMPADRRLKLLDLARRYRFTIVEDDYDPEFHFAHSPVFPLASMDAPERVFFIGSLSKVLAPGLRLGFVAASPDVIERCAAQIMLIDRQGNALTEMAVTELMASGELKRHIRRALKTYERRRDLCAELVARACGDDVSFTLPGGGLALWLTLGEHLPVRALAERARQAGIHLLAGAYFSAHGEDVQGLRLGYGNLDEDELTTAIRRLGRLMKGS